MSTLSLRLPESLHNNLKAMAQRDGISINQFVTLAVAEKLAALMTEEYLLVRAQRGNREHYLAALAQVPGAEPADFDRMPESSETRSEN